MIDSNDIQEIETAYGERFEPKPFESFDNQQTMNTPYLTGAIINETAISLSWNAIEGAAGYKIRRDGFVLDAGNQTSYAIGSLPPGQTFTFDVAAYDADGVESAYSNRVVITPSTLAVGAERGNFQPRNRQKIILRTATANGLPPIGNNLPASQISTTGAPAAQPMPAQADEKLFGYDKTTVLIVGGVGLAGIALYMLSGKK